MRERRRPIAPDDEATLLAEARAPWPELAVDALGFIAFAREKGAFEEPLRRGDLYFAYACGTGVERAQRTLDAALLAKEHTRLKRSAQAEHADEVLQRARAVMLLDDGTRRPRILDYSGRGPLRAWVRAVVRRELLMLLRKLRAGSEPEDDGEQLRLETASPELQLLRARHGSDFRRAFAAALEHLEPRERTVLRLNALDGLSIDHIAGIYHTHRATAARWIVRARERVLELTREELRASLQLGTDEVNSLLPALRSELEVSLRRLLGEGPQS